jgi:hypothetical protein
MDRQPQQEAFMVKERKYQMTRVAAGSYLLPSNDGETLWHIYSFMDGEAFGLTGEPNVKYWACARFEGTLEEAIASVERDMDEFGYIQHDSGYPSYRSKWQNRGSYLPTRKAAIEDALDA